jgi:hypothetical protein
MSHHTPPPNSSDLPDLDLSFLERVMRYQDGDLTGKPLAEFEAELLADENKRVSSAGSIRRRERWQG